MICGLVADLFQVLPELESKL